MRKFIYKQYKKFRGCTNAESKILNSFIKFFPYKFEYIYLQFPISNIDYKSKNFNINLLRDSKFLFSSRIDAIFVNNNIWNIVELKQTANLFSLLQVNYYYNLMRSFFPEKKYSRLIILCHNFDPVTIKHAEFLNIILIQVSPNASTKPNFLTFNEDYFNKVIN